MGVEMKFSAAILATIGSLAMPATAQSAIVTKTFAFSASDFFPAASPPPVPIVTGSFTVTFDDAVSVFDTTAGLAVNGLNIPVSSPIAYTYETGPFSYIQFGGRENGLGTLVLATNDILLNVSFNFPSVLLYSSTQTPDASFFSSMVSVRVSDGPAAVPELSTWAMLLSGFALSGMALRRKHQRFREFA
jgi:hypothetical protein